MKHLLGVVACAIFVLVPLLEAQDSATKQLASRVELHPIQSLTLSDEHFLKGEEAGAKAVTVGGELRIAQGEGRLPVVVMIHGSNGITAANETWSSQFNEMGVSTFVLDALTGRGLTSQLVTDQTLLGRLNFIVDAYRALGILAKHARVDPSKIVLMGFSRGGQAALYGSLKRFHRMWNLSGVEFAGYIPFYPDCSTTFVTDLEVADRPIRIFHGRPDDGNPVATCLAYMEKLRRAGRDVQLTEYPNAQHGFDNPLYGTTPFFAKDLQTVRHCSIREEPVGQLINVATKQPFTYKDSCVERGSHVGYDPTASRAAHQAVGDFVRTVMKFK
jgi:dienelactone hydrolase